MRKKTKRQSVSSVLAERRRERAAVTPSKFSVRYVKFTPEEMAYDPPPEETDKWIPVGRGRAAIFARPQDKKKVELDADVAKVFKDSGSVNRALRKLIKAAPAQPSKRKSA